jgi:hypothetical protein
VQGDSACDPAEISAARGQSRGDSSTSTGTKLPSTCASAPTGAQVQPRFPAGPRGSAVIGVRPGVALGQPKAPLLPNRFSRSATAGAAAALPAQRQANLLPIPAAVGNSSRTLGATAAGVQGHQSLGPCSNSNSGFQVCYSNAGQCTDAVALGGGGSNASCSARGLPTPQSGELMLPGILTPPFIPATQYYPGC